MEGSEEVVITRSKTGWTLGGSLCGAFTTAGLAELVAPRALQAVLGDRRPGTRIILTVAAFVGLMLGGAAGWALHDRSIQQLETRCDALEQALVQLQAAGDAWKQQLAEKEEEVRKLQTVIETGDRQFKELKEQHKKLEDEFRQFQREILQVLKSE
jgi:uncharacterized protein HemX